MVSRGGKKVRRKMPVERRISRALSLFSATAVPLLFLLISLPSRLDMDRSALYAVAASLAVLSLLHYAVRTGFPREGETLTGMPEFLGGTLALAVLAALAMGFGGGCRGPFATMAFFCALLAGLALEQRLSFIVLVLISASSLLACAVRGGLDWVPASAYPAWFLVGTLLGMDLRRELLQAEAARDALSTKVASCLERERAKSERISAVSHELRTPLTSMQGFAEILAGGRIGGEKGEEFARIIRENAERMLRLASGLLDLSRVESADPSLMERVDLAQLAEEVCENSPILREGVRIQLERPQEKAWIRADPHMVRLALGNLVSNAVKFSPPGEDVKVRVEVMERYVSISVEDRGPGIPREELPFIFHSFRRGPGAREADPRGAGLGLAVVKGVAEVHGGSVRVESEPGKGSTFTILFPLPGETAAARPSGGIGREKRDPGEKAIALKAHPWALPLFTVLYPGLLVLGGRAGFYHPAKAFPLLAAQLIVLRTVPFPTTRSTGSRRDVESWALVLFLAAWTATSGLGPALSLPLFLASAAFLERETGEGRWPHSAFVSVPAYILSSLPSPPLDPMVLATGACSVFLLPWLVLLVSREIHSLGELVDQLRKISEEANRRDREASRLMEAAGTGMIEPLERISQLSRGLISAYSTERAVEAGRAILEEASELSEVVTDLLELMRIEAGRSSLASTELGPLETADLLREAIPCQVELRAGNRGEPGRISVDAERLSRALRHATRSWTVVPRGSVLLEWQEGEGEVLLILRPREIPGRVSMASGSSRGVAGVESLAWTLAERLIDVQGGSLEALPGESAGLIIRLPRAPASRPPDG